MQRCRHAAISTHSRMGLWWATNQPPANGEPLDVASPVLRCQGRGYEDAEALHGRRRVCTRHGYLLCAWWGGDGFQRGRGADPRGRTAGPGVDRKRECGRLVFFAGAWLIILMGFLGIVALVGFYDALQLAERVMILAPILGAVGLTLVTVSHLIPIAMGYELVPAYIAADPAGQATLAATAATLVAIALMTNAAGKFLNFGVVVPLYAVAILTTRALPRWIGWLGLLVGALAGWLGLLSPASSVISAVSSIGFFVFMLTMGIALLRRRSKVNGVTQA